MLEPGTLLQGRYRVVRHLGQGGMGAVYEAAALHLRAPVALKETFASTDEQRRAFEREAHLLANLRHAALPKVIDHFTEGHGHYLVMEYVPGEDLERRLERRALPFAAAEVAAWADRVLGALDYLHARRPPVLHRDVKPANIKLTDEGDLYLLDFGLAKGTAGGMTAAQSGKSLYGYSAAYAPPEQIQGAGTDPRSDLYALGATLYHLLTKVTPPEAFARAFAVSLGQPDPLTPADRLNPQVPPAIARLLAQAMSLDISRRPQSAAEMRAALRDIAASLPAADETRRPAAGTVHDSADPAGRQDYADGGRARPHEAPPPQGWPQQSWPRQQQGGPSQPDALRDAAHARQHGGPPPPALQKTELLAPPQAGLSAPGPARGGRGLAVAAAALFLLAAVAAVVVVAVYNWPRPERASAGNLNAGAANQPARPAGAAAEEVSADVAATVNGRKITLSQVDKAINNQAPGRLGKLSPTELAAARLQALDTLIHHDALYQRAEREGLLPSEDEITQVIERRKREAAMTEEEFRRQLREVGETEGSLRERARRDLAVEKLIDREISREVVRDDEIRDFFHANKEQFVKKRGVGLSMIVADPRDGGGDYRDDAKNDAEATDKIRTLHQSLRQGYDFSEVARMYSEDPSAMRGGDIGYATEAELRSNGFPAETVRALMGTMALGEVTDPIRFDDGRRIIFKLLDRQLADEQLYLFHPGVQDQIKQTILSQRRQLAGEALLRATLNETRVVNYLARGGPGR